ncbi:ExeM/NucH family extracellular endonuclease [Oscillatoriales cyanobacterium LEGE 11467]|uniref:ExeM/NucH family extracellular endonuclease n=1 Tax=Zarconia navalis LEGE 11467 TaxID=1828826 RepID=A0A928VZC0_9CYAN|nr:ExeM/NucH family extracellular endonuclease [Zarconia navalis]MBE9040963.1 ExeM/NucH family extracellular endonuclease [Zarconia navalis LEGE 11467]
MNPIASQNFNSLADGNAFTTDGLADGGQLTNLGSFNNDSSNGLTFSTFWFDTRSVGSGPVTPSSDSSDFIGVNSFAGSSSPDVAADGTSVASGVEHNFEFNDSDGRLDLVFAAVDVTGEVDRLLSFDYWIADTSYESDDAFFFTLSDGINSQTFLNFSETELEANASADNGSANWNGVTVDLDDLIDNQGFGENLTLTISVDTNASSENIFVDNILFAGDADDGGNGGGNGGGGDITKIHEIQGTTDTSDTGTYTIEAVVTEVFPGLGGFYIQEEDADADANPLTSEGLFVFSSDRVNVGDTVEITGDVVEQFGQTQMNPTAITVVGTDALPTATTVRFPIADVDDLESYEGMLVDVQAASGDLTVTEHFNFDRFGEVLLSSGGRLEQFTQNNAPSVSGFAAHLEDIAGRSILIDDGRNGQNNFPIPNARGGNNLTSSNTLRGGDTVSSVTGILGFGFGNYRVQPTEPIDYQATNPRPAEAPNVGGNVTVASFNLLNYFNGNGMGSGFPTARGAETFSDFQRQTEKLVTALDKLDADIIAVQEVENDYGDGANSAIQDLLDALNAETERNYTYVDPGVPQLGSDAIAVGIIYDADVVQESGTAAFLNTPGLFDGVNTNRTPLAQSFEVIDANNSDFGEEFTVAANHFKSKGDRNGTATGANADAGDGQGNWNQRRLDGADAVTSWLAADPTGSGDDDVLIIGDLNAYTQEDPIAAIENAGYTNIVTGDYSFVFSGQWGSLDRALANGSLASQVTGGAKWHVNADEPDALDYSSEFNDPSLFNPNDEFRNSDHDPLVLGLDLSSDSGCNPTSGSDDLTACATSGDDVVKALGGDDTVSGGEGNDILRGNRGNDILDGEAGDDTLGGGTGDDTVTGGDGRDRILGWTGNDFLTGGSDSDTVRGGDGDDTLIGVDDTLGASGTGERDILIGDAGADLFVLGDENGAFYDDGATVVSEGWAGRGVVRDFEAGTDTIQLFAGGSYELRERNGNTQIWEVSDPVRELIAIVRDAFALDLEGSEFTFV